MTARPSQDALFDVPAEDEPRPTPPPPPKQPKAPPPRESDGVCAIYLSARGQKYKHQGAKDADAWKRMRAVASVHEIEERWRVGLAATGWNHVDTIAQLDMKWNELGALVPRAQPIEEQRPVCEFCGAPAWHWFSRVWLCSPHVEAAYAVADRVPQLEPRPTSLQDGRIREYQFARDLAVSEWVRTKSLRSNTNEVRR